MVEMVKTDFAKITQNPCRYRMTLRPVLTYVPYTEIILKSSNPQIVKWRRLRIPQKGNIQKNLVACDVATSDILHSTFDIRHFQDVIWTHHNIATSITLQTFTVILTFQIFEALVFGAGTRYSAVKWTSFASTIFWTTLSKWLKSMLRDGREQKFKAQL